MDDDRGIWNDSAASELEPSIDVSSTVGADDEVSRPFVGRWNGLVSDTNWEKGRIICQWREALQAANAPPAEFSDEAWSRRVGGVTGQHVGRLRRVYQRFGSTQANYGGLYWSHFFAALDWGDAEMWLEGAVQNGWSVSQTRRMRWQTMGEVESERPLAEDEVHAELDEDFEPALRAAPGEAVQDEQQHGEAETAAGMEDDEGVLEIGHADEEFVDDEDDGDAGDSSKPARVRPFASIPDLPDDLAEAFDAFKLAILAHRSRSWQEVAADDVLATLDALKALVLAPIEE